METNMEDYALIDRFLAGEEEGLELLVKKYQDYVLNVIYSLVGDVHQADDIAQEVFI
jgi:DNA-directed RNA polymerase specialized sigma24 family protein